MGVAVPARLILSIGASAQTFADSALASARLALPAELDDISDGLAAVSATEANASITWRLRQPTITKP